MILAYHAIDDWDEGLSVPLDQFRRHLDWIEASRISVVSVGRGPYPPPGHPPVIAITFDDGYRSVAEAAWPELRSRHWPATVYVVTDYLAGGRYFDWDRGARAKLIDLGLLKELAEDGMGVGSHSSSHRYLPALPDVAAKREIQDSRRYLEDAVGREITAFAYPTGGWNARIRRTVAASGYTTAVTVDRGRNLSGRDPFSLRRHVVERDPVSLPRMVKGYYDFLRPFDWGRERIRHSWIRVEQALGYQRWI